MEGVIRLSRDRRRNEMVVTFLFERRENKNIREEKDNGKSAGFNKILQKLVM